MDEWIDIGPHVVSGVIDNSEKSKTMIELVIDGRVAPVVLELHGNAQPDLAGCILKFRCPRTWPVQPEVADYLPPQRQTGNAGLITAAVKRDTWTEDGSSPMATILCCEWYDFSTLTRYVFERADCELEVDLPRWTLTDDELELQRKELQAAEQVFEQMGEEFEEDQLDQEIYEDQREKLDTIMPQLEAAGSDEEKLQLMKAALGPDVDENEVNGWFDVLFSPEDTGWDLPAPAENPKRREGLIELDEEIKTAGRNLADAATLLRSRVEGAGDVGAISELVDGVIHTTSLLMTEGLLEALPDGIRRIEPYAMLAMLEREMRQCETVIQSLELNARKSDRARYSDSVWALRGIVGELIAVLEAKKPAERPPPREEDCGDDVPI